MVLKSIAVTVCGVVAVFAQTPTTIPTPYGPVTGLIYERSREFRGLPFAELTPRWEAPVPLTVHTEPIDATRNRDACPQGICDGVECPAFVSEDCLYLTIHTPLPEHIAEPLPVMVYLHGGNFVAGAGSVLLYDGTHFANVTEVITVGVNYRLGAFGYLDIPEAGISGNVGLLDQIEALRFVNQAISAFGGDPNRVTLFGQSAGGTSLAALMTAKDSVATNYFQQVVAESNPFGLKIRTKETAAMVANDFLKGSKCTDVPNLRSCLNSLTTEEVREHQRVADNELDFGDFIANFYKWTPVIDGELVLDQPLTVWRAGEIPDIPMIIGHTSEEGVLYGYSIFTSPMSKLEYILIARLLFPELPLLDAYPAEDCQTDPIVDCRDLISTAITHYIWICPVRDMMRGMATELSSPLYQYRYDHAHSFNGWGGPDHACIGRVCHGAEIPFVWNGCFIPDRYPQDLQCDGSPEENELDLGNRMGQSWGEFAYSSNPNIRLLDPWTWEQFGAGDGQDNYMVFDSQNTGPINRLFSDICDMHDEAGYHPELPRFSGMSPKAKDMLYEAGWIGDDRMGKPRTMENFRRWLNATYGPFY